MGFELIIAGEKVASNKWSGPRSLRSSYRGIEPGSRECGGVDFTLFDTKLMRRQMSSWIVFRDGASYYADTGLFGIFPAVMTIVMWVYFLDWPPVDGGVLMGCGYEVLYYRCFNLQIYNDGGTWRAAFLQSTDGMGFQTFASSVQIGTQGPHLVVARNNGIEAAVWVDNVPGTVDSSPAIGDLRLPISMPTIKLGSLNGAEYFSKVAMKEIGLYKRAFSEAEIGALWTGGSP